MLGFSHGAQAMRELRRPASGSLVVAISYQKEARRLEKKVQHMKMRDLWGVVHQRESRAYFLLIVVTYAYILLSAPFSLPRLIALVGLGVIYTLTGLFGLEYCLHVSSWPIVLAYFVEQIAISAVILFLSQGAAFFLLTPLAAYSVLLLSRR